MCSKSMTDLQTQLKIFLISSDFWAKEFGMHNYVRVENNFPQYTSKYNYEYVL